MSAQQPAQVDPKTQHSEVAAEPPSVPFVLDPRTQTEVDPAVVVHYVSYQQGAAYSDPYPELPEEPPPPAKEEKP